MSSTEGFALVLLFSPLSTVWLITLLELIWETTVDINRLGSKVDNRSEEVEDNKDDNEVNSGCVVLSSYSNFESELDLRS
jgi:hypothetical protein